MFLKKSAKYSTENKHSCKILAKKTFCSKQTVSYILPKYYGKINDIIPIEHYSETYKLKYG